MFRAAAAFALAVLTCDVFTGEAVFADEMPPLRHWRPRHRWHYLPPARHVVEVVQPPYSGNFIINGIRFTGMTAACLRWTAGDRITLLAGDWHGHCITAVFYNFRRHSTCQTWCRAAF
jgi:hypothetical protein